VRQNGFVSDGYDGEAIGRLVTGGASSRALVVAAHPDDEAIGAGALLKYLSNAAFIHVTDGAARNMRAAVARGFQTREAYAGARRGELLRALNQMRSAPVELIEFGIADLEASYNLVEASLRTLDAIKRLRPDAVFVHPYEGGHPDHDAAAFSARAAVELMRQEGEKPPALVEFTSYHARGHRGMATSSFLPGTAPEVEVRLTDDERAFKIEMFSCYATQRNALRQFEVLLERFRRAPIYDFTRPAHPGRLFYQNFEWGLPWQKWRALVRKAISRLGLLNGPRVGQDRAGIWRKNSLKIFFTVR